MSESNNAMVDMNRLSNNTQEAISEMVVLTKESIKAFEEETNAIALSDDFSFGQLSIVKREANNNYQAAAREFLTRKDEFLKMGSAKLEELKNLQAELKSLARINMSLLEPLLPEKKIQPK